MFYFMQVSRASFFCEFLVGVFRTCVMGLRYGNLTGHLLMMMLLLDVSVADAAAAAVDRRSDTGRWSSVVHADRSVIVSAGHVPVL